MFRPYKKIKISWSRNQIIFACFALVITLSLASPQVASAIFFLLLLPVGIGAVVATIIIEAVFWCIVAFCNGSDGSDPNSVNVCDPRHPEHAEILPQITISATVVNPGVAWSQDPRTPGPNDNTRLEWSTVNADRCWFDNPIDGTAEHTVDLAGSETYRAGEETYPGRATSLRIRCEHDYSSGSVSCLATSSKAFVITIPPPDLSTPSAFVITPATTRYGSTAEYNWNIAIVGTTTPPYRLNCQIAGALNSPYSFNADTIPTGTRATKAVTNTIINTLTCTEPISNAVFPGHTFSTQERLEVIPQAYEI